MKLLNPELRCGGPDGCGAVLTFLVGTTVEEAREYLAKHKAERRHADLAKSEREFRESIAALKREFLEGTQ